MIFGYTKFLEAEIERLNRRIEKLEDRNNELVIALSSKPQPRPQPAQDPTASKPPQKHSILNNEDGNEAHCTCGWMFKSDDPGELQQAVSSHYRASVVAGGRKSWPQMKAVAEAEAERKAQETQK